METEITCDPALLSCITTEEMQSVLPLIFIVIGVFLIWSFIRFERNKINGPARGTAPGQGYTTKMINMHSQGRGRDQLITIRHTKDPNKHAQAMMPAKARKKDLYK